MIKVWDIDIYAEIEKLTIRDLEKNISNLDFWIIQQLGQAIKEQIIHPEYFEEARSKKDSTEMKRSMR